MHAHSDTHTTGSENGKAGIQTHTDTKRHTYIPWAPVAKMKFYISFAVISLGNLNPKP
jgi:hypothetical protein